MLLIFISVVLGFIGLSIGAALGRELLAIILGLIGFTSPGLYVLQKIYEEVTSKNNSDRKESVDEKLQ